LTNDLLTHLQALYNSGDISGFISARMPSKKLTTGWIEQGLLSKGFTGKLQDKKNQEQLIIPADRFARLTRDLEGLSDSFIGLLILGSKGLAEPKFCVLVFSAPGDSTEFLTTVAFWTKNLNPSEIIHIITYYAFGQDQTTSSSEPDLDYIEQLKSDVSMGSVRDLLSLRIKAGRQNITEWLRDAIKHVETSKEVIAHSGELGSLSKFALLFSRWITSLELSKSDRGNIATILMKFDNRIESCFWDKSQNLATFATITGLDIQLVVNRYFSSIWADSEDLGVSRSHTPKVVIGTEKKSKPASKELEDESSERIDMLPLRDIRRRIEALEIRFNVLDTTSRDQSPQLNQSISIVQTRLVEIIDRLESLANRLNELETRLKSIGRIGR
jgi:hypothetical protein